MNKEQKKKLFDSGKSMCHIKNGKNPIPLWLGQAILPNTEMHRVWMQGWTEGLRELSLKQATSGKLDTEKKQ